MTFYERLDFLLKSKQIPFVALADALNLRRAVITEWKNNGNIPNGATCIKIANFLNVSLDFLLTGENKEDTKVFLSDTEKELIENYRKMKPQTRTMFEAIAKIMILQ